MTVIPAATLLLLRDSDSINDSGHDSGPEVFMVRRHHRVRSFSGALVFPGGKQDAGDSDPALATACTDDGSLRAAKAAAIRETFEESGVLLARTNGVLLNREQAAVLQPQRRQLIDGELALLSFCREHGLTLATDLLIPFARWITPYDQPKIFDTWFFLAPAPPGQLAAHDGDENTDSMWVRPIDAIRRAENGELSVVFPTRMSLTKLGRSNSVAAALAAAATDTGASVAVQPQAQMQPDGRLMSIPAEAGYGASRVHVSKDGRHFTLLG